MIKITKNNTMFNVVDNINNQWFLNHYKTWEPQTFAVIDKLLEKNTTFLDIGSWIGPVLLYIAPRVKRIIAIDCDDVATDILEENISCNDFKCKIDIERSAIYNENKKINAGGGIRHAKWGGSEITILNTKKNNKIVNAITMDSLVEKYNITDCGFVKMDIEGGEYFIIKSMRNFFEEKKPILYVSLHPHLLNNIYLKSVISNLFKIFPYVYNTRFELLDKKETTKTYLENRISIRNKETPSNNGHELICTFKKINYKK